MGKIPRKEFEGRTKYKPPYGDTRNSPVGYIWSGGYGGTCS